MGIYGSPMECLGIIAHGYTRGVLKKKKEPNSRQSWMVLVRCCDCILGLHGLMVSSEIELLMKPAAAPTKKRHSHSKLTWNLRLDPWLRPVSQYQPSGLGVPCGSQTLHRFPTHSPVFPTLAEPPALVFWMVFWTPSVMTADPTPSRARRDRAA